MATQSTTETAFKLLLAECADAIATSSWATAYSKYAQAEAVLASMPRSTSAAGSLTVFRENLVGVKNALDAAVAASKHSDNKRRIQVRFGPGYRR